VKKFLTRGDFEVTVSPIQNSAMAAEAASSASAKATLDYDTFLRLLVAQMKNQDPTKPMDSTEYVAQLATFSNVEQLIASNRKLDQLVAESRMAQGASLVGLRVTSLESGATGIVESVRITSSGIVAALDGGDEMLITDQVSISR
jgi:flagellar basal-body rod modification protein FlgD